MFFENPNNFPLLITLRSISIDFENAITQMEGKGVDLITAISTFEDLHKQVMQDRAEKTRPPVVDFHIKDWPLQAKINFENQLYKIYDHLQEYMLKWSTWTGPLKLHLWATLKAELNEEIVLKSAEAIKSSCPVDVNELKANIGTANAIIINRLPMWSTRELSTSQRWVDMLNSCSNLDAFENIATYILTLPGIHI